ncbi:MAG: cytochrome c4 [Rubrivivax sp.]
MPDTLAQRLLACTPCHGEQGVSTNRGYLPRIAGKPAGYLHNQLLNFREGRRHNATMSRLTATLSDDYLQAIGQHFAALDLPYQPPRPQVASPASVARGRTLVEHGDPARQLPACVACHGGAMMGVAPAIPGLLGLPSDYVLAQLGAWRTGLRQAQAPDCMLEIAQRLDIPDLVALASYLAAQPVPPGAKPVPGLPQPLPLPCGGMPR